ncbi:hypothetical protein BD410DRAFT_129824 [Rickenella mellea]|uniref:RBR-type E3 ubiquitin transferase n=1 Tax=Rickenella mellea TaxID=50990 RepID=A0A4Y7Q9Q8_9AGAM|nr:hypothetical protein BD410DRAFT_129824 [Rickenella mellea]
MSVDVIHAGPSHVLQVTSDADLLELTCHLTLSDLDEFVKGKGREDDTESDTEEPLSDIDLAIALTIENARSTLAILRDSKLAHSIDTALDIDQDLLEVWNRVEIQAQEDRAMALRLSGQTPAAPAPSMAVGQSSSLSGVSSDIVEFESTLDIDQDLLEEWNRQEIQAQEDRAMALRLSGQTPGAPSLAVGPSSSHSTFSGVSDDVEEPDDFAVDDPQVFGRAAPIPSGDDRRECVICQEPTTALAYRAPCGDYYHSHCLVSLVEATTRDESLFPLRCCNRQFEVTEVQRYIPSELRRTFAEKSREFSTPERIYCSTVTCGAFLVAKTAAPAPVTCARCAQRTCSSCAAPAHSVFVPCNDELADAGVQEFLVTADNAGWQRCPDCRQVVELSMGCYHITCRCGAQFCYLCSAKWKTCNCHQVGDHQFDGGVQRPPVAREVLVRDAAERLRFNHGCQNVQWLAVLGAGQCQNCLDNLSRSLLQCSECQMLACVRCRRNRIQGG